MRTRRGLLRSRPLQVLLASLLTASGLALVSATQTSCQTHVCDSSFTKFGPVQGEGHWTDETMTVWETSANEAEWIDFHGAKLYLLEPPGIAGRPLRHVLVYISPARAPNTFGENFTLASGSAAQVTRIGDGFFVYNSTCADYYTRIVFTFAPFPPPVDAGPDADGGDGSTDGAPDAEAPDASDASAE